WEEVEDPSSGTVYYYNSETCESSWDRPTSADGENTGELPESWIELEEPTSGQIYYYNSASGETSWERPNAE
ncbi:hypothetical protein FRACYDRAFT_165441, partial [Fragilariopsis cylindrus CCMP1102]